jgi:hypothetical protein
MDRSLDQLYGKFEMEGGSPKKKSFTKKTYSPTDIKDKSVLDLLKTNRKLVQQNEQLIEQLNQVKREKNELQKIVDSKKFKI